MDQKNILRMLLLFALADFICLRFFENFAVNYVISPIILIIMVVLVVLYFKKGKEQERDS